MASGQDRRARRRTPPGRRVEAREHDAVLGQSAHSAVTGQNVGSRVAASGAGTTGIAGQSLRVVVGRSLRRSDTQRNHFFVRFLGVEEVLSERVRAVGAIGRFGIHVQSGSEAVEVRAPGTRFPHLLRIGIRRRRVLPRVPDDGHVVEGELRTARVVEKKQDDVVVLGSAGG